MLLIMKNIGKYVLESDRNGQIVMYIFVIFNSYKSWLLYIIYILYIGSIWIFQSMYPIMSISVMRDISHYLYVERNMRIRKSQ